MRLNKISIKNFKALRDVTVPMSRFVCVIGENNAGKSTFMLALMKFIEGGKLDHSFYFDPNHEITITVRIEEITSNDLELITNTEHRSRFAGILRNNAVTLVRRYPVEESSRLQWIERVPKEQRFDPNAIDKMLEGKKPSSQFASEL